MQEIISRKDALAQGLKRYFVKPCKKGHATGRYVSSKECVDCSRERTRSWRKKNPKRWEYHWKKYQRGVEADPQRRAAKRKRAADWAKRNPGKHKASIARCWRRSYQENPQFRLASAMRSRIRSGLKRGSRAGSTPQLLGCSIADLAKHLERQFRPGMTWDNYGEWHVDHILPCAAFDLTSPIGQRLCFHYTNLQPLWARDNQRKGANVLSVVSPC